MKDINNNMTRKRLAKLLNVPSYHGDEMYWDMIDSEKLLKIINEIKPKPKKKKKEIVTESESNTYRADHPKGDALDGCSSISDWEDRNGRGFWGSAAHGYFYDKDVNN